MFEALIASSLCFYVNAQGQTIELSDRCLGSTASILYSQYTTREAAFLAEYRQLHPESTFTDAEALLSGRVSCGEGGAILSANASGETIPYEDEAEFVDMLMQHWEASHKAAISQLCPHLRNLSRTP
jgi:hypothetical protein